MGGLQIVGGRATANLSRALIRHALKIFISYRHVIPDETLAGYITTALSGRHQVFIDTHIEARARWAEQIETELRDSDAFVVLLSGDSIRSDMVRKEIQIAHELAAEPDPSISIYPIRVDFEDELPYDLAAYLNPIQYLVWRHGQAYDEVVQPLANAINKVQRLPEARGLEGDNSGGYVDTPNDSGAPLPVADVHLDTGPVKSSSPYYIEREQDKEALRLARQQGTTTIIKGARQFGKSSLLARVHRQARSGKLRSCYVDFQLIDERHLTSLDTLCRYLADKLAVAFKTTIQPEAVWNPKLGPGESLTDFLEDAVLAEAQAPSLLILDEADRIFERGYCSDFFALIRAWHGQRTFSEEWDFLNLVIAHSTEPYLWIRDINQSPFNVGVRLQLDEFEIQHFKYLDQLHGQILKTDDQLRGLQNWLAVTLTWYVSPSTPWPRAGCHWKR